MSAHALAKDTQTNNQDDLHPQVAIKVDVSPYQSALQNYQTEEAEMTLLVSKLRQENVALLDTSIFTQPSLSAAATDEQTEQVSEKLRAFFGDAYLEDAHELALGYDISYIEALQALKRQDWLGDINQALIDGEAEKYGGVYFDSATQQATILLPDSASLDARRMAEQFRLTGNVNVVDTGFTMLEMENKARQIMAELKASSPDLKVRAFPNLKKLNLVIQVEASDAGKQLVAGKKQEHLFAGPSGELSGAMNARENGSTIPVEFALVDEKTLNVEQYGPKTPGATLYFHPRVADRKHCSSSFHVVSERGDIYASSNSHCPPNVSLTKAVDGVQGVKKFAFGIRERQPRIEHLIDLAFYEYPGREYIPEFRVRHGSMHARDANGNKISVRELRSLAKRGDLFPGLFVCKFGNRTARTCGEILATGRWDRFQPDGSTLPGLETLMIGSLPKHNHSVFSAKFDSGSGIYRGYQAVATMWGGGLPSIHKNIPSLPGLTDVTWAIPAWYAQDHLFSDIRRWHNVVRTYARDIGYLDFTSAYDRKWASEINAGFNHNLDYFYMTVDNAPSNCTDYGLSIVQVRADSITCGLPIPSAQPNPVGTANNAGVGRPRMTPSVGSSGSSGTRSLNGAIFGSGIRSGGWTYGGSSRQSSGSHSNGTGFPRATVNNRNGDSCNVRWCQHVRPVPRYEIEGMEHGFAWENTFNQTVSCAALNNMDTIELIGHDNVTASGKIQYTPGILYKNGNTTKNLPTSFKCTTMREYFAN